MLLNQIDDDSEIKITKQIDDESEIKITKQIEGYQCEGQPNCVNYGKNVCLVCKQREPCVLFRSCYEVVTCENCAHLLTVCPACNVSITQRVVISM